MNMRTQRPATTCVLLLYAFVGIGSAQVHGLQRAAGSSPAQPTVLFLCPHGAAKSVLASAYFQKAAQERGLNVRVDAAGTEPDDQVSPKVADHLRRNGYRVPVNKPRKVTGRDIETADVIISIGCDVSALKVPAERLRRWDEVPGPSENLKAAGEAIRLRVTALVEELLAQQKK